MKIDRSKLISELAEFAREGNGLIIGPPGVGKSYALAELRERLKQSGIPHLVLPVERLGGGTEAELKTVLHRDGDFVELLRTAVENSTPPAILIFDGFDAARGDNERAGILRLIFRSVNELRGRWNTIVSVRTFDAEKSQRLLELFPKTNNELKFPGQSCRTFLIPRLRDEEVQQAMQQIEGLREIRSHGTPEFRILLTVPFNLWLIERVLGAGAKANEFSQVTSEVQLLEMYWNNRVRKASHPEDREFILLQTASAMVKDHALAVRRDRIYKPDVRLAWEGLFSDEVLSEIVKRETYVAFSHNILFDFAVSVHLLEADPTKLAQFLAEEPARPLFLRPSLVYHFTRLWHFDRADFWRSFWGVIHQDVIHLRHIIRLVLPSVVVNEARTINDLRPLLESLATNKPRSEEAVAFLLQALRVLQSSKHELWAEFLCSIGSHFHPKFAWDAGIIATGIVDAKASSSGIAVRHCGEFGLLLLDWAWSSRFNGENRQWLERLAGIIAIPLVAKTYATKPETARRLLEGVLQVVGQAAFPIDCIWRLANDIGYITPHDPEFVGMIYERVFGYEEHSQDVTNKGGPVMSFSSTRHQDYGMCRYSLMKEFPSFLSLNPSAALGAGMRAIQAFAIQDHVVKYLPEGKTLNDLTITFSFHGTTAHYIEDGSAIWDRTRYPDRELEIADRLFTWLAEASKDGRVNDIAMFLDIFVRDASLAFLWSRLLSVGADQATILAPHLWELAKTEPLFGENDILYTLGAFLERAATSFLTEQRQQIEGALLAFARGASDDHREFAKHRRNRLLARIPSSCLVTGDAKDLRNALECASELPPNQPLFSSQVISRTYTESEFLRDQGAKPEAPANQEVQKLYNPIKEWNQTNKDESQIDALMSSALALRELLSKNTSADAPVLRAAWTHLSSFAAEAVRRTKSAEIERFPLLRQIVLEAAVHPDPVFNPDSDPNWSNASWSPAPRNEAAQSLPWLTHLGKDEEALAAIQKLAHDPVPSVRFLLACELWRLLERTPELMWSLLDEISEKEGNSVVLQGITVSLWQLIPKAKDQSLRVIAKLLARTEEESEDEQKPRSHLISMIVDYALLENNQWAEETLARWRSKPIDHADSIAMAGQRIIEYIIPDHIGTTLQRARDLLLLHLNAAADGLIALQHQKEKLNSDEIQRTWKLLYGVIDNAVMRIYFASDVDPNSRERKEHPLDDEARVRFFREALPILEKVLSFGKQQQTGMLLAPTAHHFMELLNGILRYDPALVLRMAAEVVTSSRRFGYNLDLLAMQEAVKLVESILADYRDKVQQEQSIKHLLELLDAFVEAGWPEALNLVWRLDEIYR